MREIKFRVWNPEKKTMSMVGALDWTGDYKLITCNIWNDKMYRTGDKDFDFVLMQYIGIKDKNGKEIYEGDIIVSNLGDKGEIKWLPEQCVFVVRRFEPHSYCYLESDGQLNNVEIIGNIYESEDE